MNSPQVPADTPATIPWRNLAWAIGPVIAVLLLRAWLQAQGELDDSGLQRLRSASLVSSPEQALWVAARPFALSALALLALGLGGRWGLRRTLRRWGWAGVRPWVLGLWVALWLGWGGWLLASHANRIGNQALDEQRVRVLLSREIMPSQRHAGGVEVYFEPASGAAPLRLLAENARLADLAPNSMVRLSGVHGRWWGRWARLTPLAEPSPEASSTPPSASP